MSLEENKVGLESSWTVLNDANKEQCPSTVEEVKETKNEPEDDFSDGISIISESDNSHCGDSPSANDCSGEQLKTKNVEDTTTPLVSTSEETDILRRELRLLRQQSQQLIEQGKELVIARRDETDDSEFWAAKIKVTWKFFIFALVLILAFIGTLSHFWLSAPKDLELARRLDEVTAQNEILRLEIDNLFQIIDRLKENRFKDERNKNKPKMDDRAKIKVWPGNGNSFDQIEIPKVALKSSYNCGDTEDDIAGFCVASDADNKKPLMQEDTEPINQKIVHGKETSEKDFQDRKKFKNSKQSSKKKYNSSEERRDKSSQSKEKKHEKCKDCKNKHSGERKNKNKKNYSKENEGDWHDNMMKNREKQRKHKEKYDENNWYVERGHGREQSRSAN